MESTVILLYSLFFFALVNQHEGVQHPTSIGRALRLYSLQFADQTSRNSFRQGLLCVFLPLGLVEFGSTICSFLITENKHVVRHGFGTLSPSST